MNKSTKFSPEVKERAVRLVQEYRGEYPSLWAAVESIAPRLVACHRRSWNGSSVSKAMLVNVPGTTIAEAQRMKDPERENKELRRANDILRTASAFFAQAELDRKLKS